jgi:hypothetical protein
LNVKFTVNKQLVTVTAIERFWHASMADIIFSYFLLTMMNG